MRDRVVVITGASGGIGAALAEKVAQQGGRLVLAARRERELNEVAKRCGDAAQVVVADVTNRADVQRILDAALVRFDHVDVWVNNAGRGITQLVSRLTDDVMRTNVKSALYGMQTVLPHFRERGRGHIINLSSMLGRVPHALMRSAYTAGKHALNALTANLRMELSDTPDIHVTTVSPGVVATDFGLHARNGGPDSRSFPGAQSPEEVADVIVDVIRSPRADVYTRPEYQQRVVDYFSAEDMAELEARWQRPAPVPAAGGKST